MTSVEINLKSIEQIRDFVNTVSRVDYDVDLCSGRYQVNAKSIMGVCSLDLSQPVVMVAHTDDSGELLKLLIPYSA